MCGIAGLFAAECSPAEGRAALQRMTASLVHRGPDGCGHVWVEELRSGLSATRLALVGIENGAQPIANEDGSLLLAANGEIYNHRRLRRELERSGHRFRSATDVEVLLHLYEECGEELVHRLNGMFAFALLDRREHRLLLARDRAGMKHLYFADTPRGFVFASEPAALFTSGWVQPEAEWTALASYLHAGYIPAPSTAFRGVSKLEAGHLLVRDANETAATTRAYWTLEYRRAERGRTDSEYAETARHLLRQSVAAHLDADVQPGVLLSGGWDSSLVATLAAQHARHRLQTFSLVFPEDPGEDESRYSDALAEAAGSEHHRIEVLPRDLPRLFDRTVARLGEPCVAAPALLFYALSEVVARSVKTVLGGEGADELFAGYPWLGSETERWYTLRLPGIRKIAAWAAPHAAEARGGRLLRVLGAHDDVSADAEWCRIFSAGEIARLLRQPVPASPALRAPAATLETCTTTLERRLALEFTRRLPDGLLAVADRMTMAHGLELRLPFLDADLLAWAAGLPADMRRRGGQQKYVLYLLRDLLPPALRRRRKHGLSAPLGRWLSGPLRPWLFDTVLQRGAMGGSLDRRTTEQWLRRCLGRDDPYMRRPWALALLCAWWNEYPGGGSLGYSSEQFHDCGRDPARRV